MRNLLLLLLLLLLLIIIIIIIRAQLVQPFDTRAGRNKP